MKCKKELNNIQEKEAKKSVSHTLVRISFTLSSDSVLGFIAIVILFSWKCTDSNCSTVKFISRESSVSTVVREDFYLEKKGLEPFLLLKEKEEKGKREKVRKRRRRIQV